MKVLAAGGQCFPAPDTWTATWISTPKRLQEMISRCSANRLGALPKEAPVVDFDRFAVLAVEMGERRSAGYGFDTGEITAFMVNGTATIRLTHHQPPPDAVTAQIMTAPWMLIRVPSGSYRVIQVIDHTGRLLARISLP